MGSTFLFARIPPYIPYLPPLKFFFPISQPAYDFLPSVYSLPFFFLFLHFPPFYFISSLISPLVYFIHFPGRFQALLARDAVTTEFTGLRRLAATLFLAPTQPIPSFPTYSPGYPLPSSKSFNRVPSLVFICIEHALIALLKDTLGTAQVRWENPTTKTT